MRATRVLSILAAVSSAAVLLMSSPVVADDAYGNQDGSGITAGAGSGNGNDGGDTSSGGTSGGSGNVPMCTAEDGSEGPVNYRSFPERLTQEQRDYAAAEGGNYYWRFCGEQSAGDKLPGQDNGGRFFPSGASGGPVASPEELATQALQRTPLPTPTITMTPPPATVLVNANMWLSIDPAQWGQRSATASAGGVTSTVVAEPEMIVWDMGDGQQVTCTGPGTPYDPGRDYFSQQPECGYKYRRSSAGYPNDSVTVTATIHYRVTWSASGAAGGGDLGTVERTSAPVAVRVNEIQTVVVH